MTDKMKMPFWVYVAVFVVIGLTFISNYEKTSYSPSCLEHRAQRICGDKVAKDVPQFAPGLEVGSDSFFCCNNETQNIRRVYNFKKECVEYRFIAKDWEACKE